MLTSASLLLRSHDESVRQSKLGRGVFGGPGRNNKQRMLPRGNTHFPQNPSAQSQVKTLLLDLSGVSGVNNRSRIASKFSNTKPGKRGNRLSDLPWKTHCSKDFTRTDLCDSLSPRKPPASSSLGLSLSANARNSNKSHPWNKSRIERSKTHRGDRRSSRPFLSPVMVRRWQLEASSKGFTSCLTAR